MLKINLDLKTYSINYSTSIKKYINLNNKLNPFVAVKEHSFVAQLKNIIFNTRYLCKA